MSLLETIKQDQLEARKAKETVKIDLLTTLYSEAVMVGKNSTPPRDTTDAEVIAMVKKFMKNTNEFLSLAGDRRDGDRVDVLSQELDLLQHYLPTQLSEDELHHIITSYVDSNGISLPKGTGLIMKHLKDNYGGLYDGATVSNFIKQLS